jgi:hypothetical protein
LISPVLIVLLVLLAAVLHASWNALVKMGGDRKLTTALVAIMSGVVCLPLLPFVDPPLPVSWPFILGSVAVHIGYYYGLSEMYETGDFSLVYPLARGLSPLLVAIGRVGHRRREPRRLAAAGRDPGVTRDREPHLRPRLAARRPCARCPLRRLHLPHHRGL